MLPGHGEHKATIKYVQFVEEEREVLEDVRRIPKDKIVEDLGHYKIDEPSSNYFFLIGSNTKEQERIELNEFLKANIEIFAWKPYEMPRIDPSFIRHELNVMSEARPVKQQERRSVVSHVDVVQRRSKSYERQVQ
ncbi:hypothetical protein Acr_02g0008420 [Actinidia rufa]|uniref:Uncharacterized protein n=1 Tax=Actinidia rufa TaxID=165716 RepID=A0A7J0E8I7_9ERIC|nr:hypothetical protein Acr_02g0008420 [Actinidia rufa]